MSNHASPDPRAKSNKHALYWIAVIPLLFILFSIASFGFGYLDLSAITLGNSTASSPIVANTIENLKEAPHTGQRIQAARWLSSQINQDLGPALIALDKTLREDEDPAVRAAAANALASLAGNARTPAARDALKSTAFSDPQKLEARIAQILHTSFKNEKNAAVRQSIAGAAGELDHESTEKVLRLALSDENPAVREEAIISQSRRNIRSKEARLG